MTDTQTIDRPDTGTDLAIIGGTVTALTVFGTEGGVDAILERITAQARAVETDISTPAGRKAVASLAYKIARSKTALDAMGKDLGEQNYRAWKAITSERSRIEKALDALADDIRRPLTDWENADKARIATHEAAIEGLFESLLFYASDNPSADLAARLKWLEAYPPRDWQEFAKRADDALAGEIAKTKVALVEAVRREAAAEAAAKAAREEAEAAAAREAERQRQREVLAAENARREAEAKAAAEAEAQAHRVEAERRAAEEAAAATARVVAENARRAREAVEARAREAEERALARAKADAEHLAAVERQKQEASDRAERAEAARIAGEAKAKADAERAAADAEVKRQAAVAQAAAFERKRIADEQAAQAAETAKREANKKHRQTVNNEALVDLVAATEITDAAGRAVITAIVSGKVRHLRVSY